jgi:DMSO/TMAO reductase YedYZ molybdopterin-dependent catalytic subunit
MKIAPARFVLCLLLLALIVPLPGMRPTMAQPQKGGSPASAVEVRGDLPKPGELKISDVESLGAVTVTWTLHGQPHAATGVPLEKVLRRFGWEPGIMSKAVPPTEKRLGYKRVVVVTAKDGFQAVFSAAELTEGMGKTQALLVWMIDGKPLPADQGPLRLVVPSDAEPSRSLYQLSRIDVVDMRRIVPVSPARN